AVGVAGSPSAEDAAFVMKLKPVQSANQFSNFSFVVNAAPAQNQGNSDGVITIDSVTGNAPYNIVVSINGNQHTSGSYSALPIVIEDVQASVNGYSIEVSNADGCNGSASAIVAGCYNFVADVTPQAVSATATCDGSATVNLSGSWGGPFNAESASMLINTQFNSTSYLLSNTLCIGTGYIVTVTDGYGCQDMDTFDVTLGCTAPPVPVLTQSNDTLFASTTGVSGGYDWYLNGGILATTAFPTNYLVITQNGSYTVIAGNGPCTSGLSDPLVVTTVSIDEVTSSAASLYPNPAKETLMIYCSSPIKSIEVYSALGARILFQSGNMNSLDVSALANGMYSVRILTTTGQQTVNTFIKK
ncbi:MAG TPA: T9SS type A sorting domain-containing protein, partial [Chitinophagales bacterium]|nr:T9SS type A sorting domain-containing protein [Chitinophagales bacterium]